MSACGCPDVGWSSVCLGDWCQYPYGVMVRLQCFESKHVLIILSQSGSHSTWFGNSMLQCGPFVWAEQTVCHTLNPLLVASVRVGHTAWLGVVICICLGFCNRMVCLQDGAVGPMPNPQSGGPGVVLSLSLCLRPIQHGWTCQGPEFPLTKLPGSLGHANPSTIAKWQHKGGFIQGTRCKLISNKYIFFNKAAILWHSSAQESCYKLVCHGKKTSWQINTT